MTPQEQLAQLEQFFPSLSDEQRRQLAALDGLYRDWNAKINVISRKDIDNLYQHHVLHSASIARVIRFRPGTAVLDVGTGGGFPGIPLAILFPQVQFRLIDSIGKKVRVAQAVISALGLKNAVAEHRNAAEEKGHYDFVVSRAVMPVADLLRFTTKNKRREQRNALPAGLFCLKGGDLSEELRPYRKRAETWAIDELFAGVEYFKDKKVVFVAFA